MKINEKNVIFAATSPSALGLTNTFLNNLPPLPNVAPNVAPM